MANAHTTPTQYQRSIVRSALGLSDGTPVTVVPGAAAPRLTGEGYYWTTPSGKTRVHHPNAYGWRTWYHHATWEIVVGADWVRAETDRAHRARMGRVRVARSGRIVEAFL
jgi:hypothetical protein